MPKSEIESRYLRLQETAFQQREFLRKYDSAVESVHSEIARLQAKLRLLAEEKKTIEERHPKLLVTLAQVRTELHAEKFSDKIERLATLREKILSGAQS